jgi:hypothetical protein
MVAKINENEEYTPFFNLYDGQTFSREVTHNASIKGPILHTSPIS